MRFCPAVCSAPRELFTATPLADGRVLLVGGFNTHRGRTQATAEVYDPVTRTFTPTGSLAADRFGQDAVRLADGRVLVVGGTHWFVRRPAVKLASAEIYDPATGRFHETRAPMHFPRDRPTATLLPDGTVLIAGGQNDAGEPEQAELFDPKTETFTLLPGKMVSPRMAHAAARSARTAVFCWRAAGASRWRPRPAAWSDMIPHPQIFTPCPTLPQGAHDQALLVFPSGLVLVAGGKEAGGGKETSLATGLHLALRPANLSVNLLISRNTRKPGISGSECPSPPPPKIGMYRMVLSNYSKTTE